MNDEIEVVQAGADVDVGETEWRVSCAYVRFPDASLVWPVAPEDVHDKECRAIIRAVATLIEKGEKVNPVNIAEASKLNEERIELRFSEWRPIWQEDMPTYSERIQAEGLRTRALRARKDDYQMLLRTPWREVETTHAEGVQKTSQVMVNGVGGEEDDVGSIFAAMGEEDYQDIKPMPFPWAWLNDNTKGGMHRHKKYVFAAPPGNYKSSALYTLMHHVTMIQGKRWIHFPFDGGAVKEQVMKVFTIHWQHTLMQRGIPLTCSAQQRDGWSDHFFFCNSQVATSLRYRQPLDFQLPPQALVAYHDAAAEFERLTRGQGEGLLTFVSPKKVAGDIYRVAQRLRNEQTSGDGLDGWSLDHMGKPSNRFHDEGTRIPENTRVTTTFTDLEGPPCILISQMSADGMKNIGKGSDVNPGLRYNNELFADADGVFLLQKSLEHRNKVVWINQKNREGEGGPNVMKEFVVIPQTGFIYEGA